MSIKSSYESKQSQFRGNDVDMRHPENMKRLQQNKNKIFEEPKEQVLPKGLIYQDRKYTIEKLDSSNYGVFRVKRNRQTEKTTKTILGYYSNIDQAFMKVVHLRSDTILMREVALRGPFTQLDRLFKVQQQSVEKALRETLQGIK